MNVNWLYYYNIFKLKMSEIIEHIHPCGTHPESKDDPLPTNWKELNQDAHGIPRNFWMISVSLYRSSLVLPNNVAYLYKEMNIRHIISLLDNTDAILDSQGKFSEMEDLYFHQFPFLQRKELTQEKCKLVVNKILELEESNTGKIIVHCNKWSVRTGMVIALYQILSWKRWNFTAFIESIKYWNINVATIKEILSYSKSYHDPQDFQ